MSLLEDVFLENEAGEAQELERIIEGDDFDERPRSRSDSEENSAKEDEAEEDKRRVDPTSAKPKRVIKNPRFVLNPARLTGPRGIQILPEHFKDFKFKGKGHERDDLDLVLKKLEHWAYRLYPKFQFEDCLKKIETLGKKRAVSVHLTKIRMDMITSEETVVQKDSSDDEAPAQEPEEDEFDKLLQQQIEIARATPAPASVKKTPFAERSSIMPKATSSPSINEEQRERMLRNRQMAEERRLARLEQNKSQEDAVLKSPGSIDNSRKKQNNSVIDSSDDEHKSETIELDTDGMVVTKSPKSYVPAKKHNKSRIDSSDDDDIESEPVLIDVEKHHTDFGTKSNNANKNNKSIDSSDDDDDKNVNNDVSSNKSETIELDTDGMVVTKSAKSYLPAKKHKKSRIDSSDDDDLESEPVTIDVEKHHTTDFGTKPNTANTNNKPIDSSDDDLINEPETADVQNHQNNTAKKHNKSNIIDSSDSEDDAVVMNESIIVDIHASNKLDTNNTNTQETNCNNTVINKDNIFDSLKETIAFENETEIGSKNIETQSETEFNKNNSSNANDNIDSCSKNNEATDLAVSAIENDEIMDVDFSEEF